MGEKDISDPSVSVCYGKMQCRTTSEISGSVKLNTRLDKLLGITAERGGRGGGEEIGVGAWMRGGVRWESGGWL